MDTSKFAELGLNEQILAGVEALGFTDPTPVQAEAIPLVLAGRDVVASAQTGTGKTAAFALPVLQVIEPYSRAARGEVTTSASNTDEEDTGADDSDAGGNTVLADVMPGDAHLSAPVPEEPSDGESTAGPKDAHVEGAGNGAASFAGDVASAPAEAEPVSVETSEIPEAATSSPNTASSAPKRPRRRHHKRAFALKGDSAEGVESAMRDEEVARADAAADADSSADAASQLQQSPSDDVASAVDDATHEGAASTKKKRRKRRAKKAHVVEVSLDGITPGEQHQTEGRPRSDSTEIDAAQAEGRAAVGHPTDDDAAHTAEPKKPKRKRSRKRSKKKKDQKSGLAAEIAAAEDPNAKPFGPFALVVTPTRELAQQIENVVSEVCEHTGQRAVIVMGGTKFDRQIRELQRGCDLLVATPGRLLDLMEHDHVDLSQVKVFVLDEADRMLDMGFWPSVRRIVAALPKERQTLLFSATIPPSIKGQVDAMLHDPAKVEIARIGETADTVEEHLCPVTQGQKIELLEALVRHYDPERVLVFCRTKHRVDDVSSYLARAGLSVEVMHADRTQKERERALAKFRAGKCKILVATDVMSRGIDVSGIDAVVNFDVPMDPEDYVHRIGRTGRAGHTGLAFTFVAPDEISPLREIEYFTHKLIPMWDLEGFEYDSSRIVPNPDRSTTRSTRTMFNGARARGRGMRAGRYGRHY